MTELRIKIVEHPMPDGTRIHSVVVVDPEEHTVLDIAAASEGYAADLASGLQALISKYALRDAKFVELAR